MAAVPIRHRSQRRIPPTALVMGAVLSVQLGSAVATHLFGTVGPGGAAFLRLAFGALILLATSRPRPARERAAAVSVAVLFGLAVAAMNFTFYSAIHRIPLGIAVALEFTGPLSVAVLGSRRALDGLWVVLAAAGVVLLTPWGGLHLDAAGIALALLTGVFWASYILLSARVGQLFSGRGGLTIALIVGSVALAPFGLLGQVTDIAEPKVLALGAVVGLLSSVVPYSLELEALRGMTTRAFGVLMSTEPAIGTLVGFLFLGQTLGIRAIAAIVLVTVAAAGASYFDRRETSAHEASP